MIKRAGWLRPASLSLYICLLLLQGCSDKGVIEIPQPELQAMINESFLSPQIKTLNVLPMVGIQVYLETPTVSLQADAQPLTFNFRGHFDADVLGNALTEPLPVEISGNANMAYDGAEKTFYFRDVVLTEASVDLSVAMFKTLIISELKKSLVEEIAGLAIFTLDDSSPLAKDIAGRPVVISVHEGKLLLSCMDET